jgi:hypothetical protein
MKKPEIPQVPWNVPQQTEPEPEHIADFVEIEEQAKPVAPTQEQIAAAFSGEPVKQASPFAPKPKEKKVEEKPAFELTENDPSWGELVNFCRQHGDKIIQAHYPTPRGECVDTLWRGIPVTAHEITQVRHIDLGWIDWKDAIYE